MKYPRIIQGGMGVAVSSWQLANTVSSYGQLGVVSGTGIGLVMVGRLMQGDPGGFTRKALAAFPFQDVAERMIEKYYVPEGKGEKPTYKRPTMWTTKPTQDLHELTVTGNFVEVWLAKMGHNNPVGINLLEKVQMPNMSSLYGAMLAGVDYVIMGAGIPIQIPGILDKLAVHEKVSYRLDVLGADADDDYRIYFDPEETFPGAAAQLGTLKRPFFLPIISSNVLATALLKRATGEINGFVVESPIAGGHNAPPRGKVQLNEKGEPIYGDKDAVNLERLEKLGKPFWLAGGYGSPEGFKTAMESGAVGIQVGTAFAYSNESGFDPVIRQKIIGMVLEGEAVVHTDPVASPTGFPFKVVQLPGSVSDPAVYQARPRLCDVGYLRHLYKLEDGSLGYRCPSEPVKAYVEKGGKLEDTVGRTCLCNHLGSAAGYAQTRKRDGYTEPPIVTSGDDLVHIDQFLKEGATSYSAREVIDYIFSGQLNGEAAPSAHSENEAEVAAI